MILFFPCSAKKNLPISASLRGGRVHADSLVDYAEKWHQRVGREDGPLCASKDLYGGVGHQAALSAQKMSGGRLKFVSAGLGIVDATKPIPPYDLTVVRGGEGPFGALDIPHRPNEWWRALHKSNKGVSSLPNLISQEPGLSVIALPSTYLQMIWSDLESIPEPDLDRLRIICITKASIPRRCASQVIRYDVRLNLAKSGSNGAMASLVQRAALHFVSTVLPKQDAVTVASQQTLVDLALNEVSMPSQVIRRAVGDEEVASAIKSMTPKERTSFSTALRSLRDNRKIACEQSRFKSIYQQVLHSEK